MFFFEVDGEKPHRLLLLLEEAKQPVYMYKVEEVHGGMERERYMHHMALGRM
jgi:hypothetical protein